MKKRVFCLLLAAALLLCVPAQADRANDFRMRMLYGTLKLYENLVYGYSLGVYSGFAMLSDEQLAAYLDEVDENAEEGDDAVYDARIWITSDYRFELLVEVKEPTYASFDEEIANAPYYAEMMADSYAKENHLRQLHDGILRETPGGTMLETAVAYDLPTDDGADQAVVFVYYDIYLFGAEYCFCLYDFQGDYDSAQSLLDTMMQTVAFGVQA